MALATFTPTATVIDDGQTVTGLEQIRLWLEITASEFNYERTLLAATSTAPDQWLIINNLTGNFPGQTVDLTYHYTLADDLIQRLTIAPIGR